MNDAKDSKMNHLKLVAGIPGVTPREQLERRLLPRVTVGSEQFKLAANGELFSMIDLSETGLALWIPDPASFKYFVVGFTLSGWIKLRHQKFAVELKVQNRGQDRVGCEFHNPSAELTASLRQFVDPVFLGGGLKPIPAPGRNTLWYFGPSGTQLGFRRHREGQFDQMSLYFLQSFVQWESGLGMISGKVLASDFRSEIQGVFRLDTLFLEPDSSIDHEKLEIAKKIILSSHLPEELKGWGVRHFSR